MAKTTATETTDIVSQARLEVEKAEEKRAALREQLDGIRKQQAALDWRDSGRYFELEGTAEELSRQLLFSAEAITSAQIAWLEARHQDAARKLAELQPEFDAQRQVVAEAQAKLSAIGEKMRPYQLLKRSHSGEMGELRRRLDNQRAERLRATSLSGAPVVRSLQFQAAR